MIVEDDRSLREIYSVRLAAEGYSIVSAGDGEEALGVVIREKPDLIISDVMMPKISGFDMLDILRSTPETKDIKVIMMTALSGVDQKERGEKLGADRYLVKSQVGIEDVVRAVHEVLNDTPNSGGAANIAVVNSIASGTEPTLPAFEPTAVPAATPAVPAAEPLPPLEPVVETPLPQLEPTPSIPVPSEVVTTPEEEPLSPTAASILNAPITPMPSAAVEAPAVVAPTPAGSEQIPVVAEPAPVVDTPQEVAPVSYPEPVADASQAVAETPAPVATPEPAPTPVAPVLDAAPVVAEEPAFPFPTLPDPNIAPNIEGSERSETVVPVDTTPSQSDMETQIAQELSGK
jgi:CheY-like chemotaxis protein